MNSGLSERKAFQQVQQEAKDSGTLFDAAVTLAVNRAEDRAPLLESMHAADNEEVYNADHTRDITRHVTEAYVADVMRLEGLSREAAELKAVKQRQYDRRNAFELLRKQTVGTKPSAGDRGNQNHRGRQFNRGRFAGGLAVAGKKPDASEASAKPVDPN